MKKLFATIIVLFIGVNTLFSQVAVNTDGSAADNSAILDVKSTNKGMLIPRMTKTQRDAISSPATGLMVFNTTDSSFYYYSGNSWTLIKNGNINWKRSDTDLSVADTTNNVGIGTSNPSGTFEVSTVKHTGTYGSNTAVGGTVTASSSYTTYTPDRAFDGNTTSEWVSNNALPAWLQYDLGTGNSKRVGKYSIYYEHPSSYDHSPSQWTFEASNDGNTWTVLDTQNGQGWTIDGWKGFPITNTAYYRYYRLNITDNKGSIDNYIQINEVQFYEEVLNSFPALFVNDNKVGIGTSNPDATLDITGTFQLTDGNQSTGKILVSDANGNATWTDGTTVNGGGWTVNGNYIYNTSDSVGIGTSNPDATLDIAGTFQLTDGNQSNGKILVSDANGNASWTDGTTVNGGGWTVNGNYIYNLSDSVGIGASPNARLTVNGRISADAAGSVIIGKDAGLKQSYYNVFLGFSAGKNTTTAGSYNVAVGTYSLTDNISGSDNVAVGYNALYLNRTGDKNIAIGSGTLESDSTGSYNVAVGYYALNNNKTGNYNVALGEAALLSNLSGNYNIAAGYEALNDNTSGEYNIATGALALQANSTGGYNIALGDSVMFSNTTGNSNIALGRYSLFENENGNYNVALGEHALQNKTSGNYNIAIGLESMYGSGSSSRNIALGVESLYAGPVGVDNIAIGAYSLHANRGNNNIGLGFHTLYANTDGHDNFAAGDKVLELNTSGKWNIGIGDLSLSANISGNSNVGIGSEALKSNTTGGHNVGIGINAIHGNTTGNYNTSLGYRSYYTGTYSNSTALGYNATITASNQIRLGDMNVTDIGGYANWTNLSDERFKKEVKENVPGLDFILKLKPVTYHLDVEKLNRFLHIPDSVAKADRFSVQSAENKERIVQTGFLAQEVEKAAQSLGYDFSGVDKPENENDYYGLRYAEFVVPIVKAVQELDSQNRQLKTELQAQRKLIEEQNLIISNKDNRYDLLLKRIEILEDVVKNHKKDKKLTRLQ